MQAAADMPAPPADATPSVRRRVLVSAFATSPYRGSEPGGGWNVVCRLAAYHDVTVLCFPGFEHDQRNHVAAYEKYIEANGPIPGLTIHWVEQPPLSKLLQREGSWQRAFYYRGYASWQREALRVARRLHAQQPFDLVHHLNMTGYREPGYLWQMDLPFLWGPVAGAVMMPRPFFKLLSPRDRAFYGIRNALNAWQMRTKSRCRKAAAKAEHIWAVDELNRAMIREHFHAESSLMLDSGCEVSDHGFVRRYDGRRPLRILWSGVHEGRKCLPILLHALVRVRALGLPFELTVLSSGPETENWKGLSRSLGIDDAVTWAGMLPQPEAVQRMNDADVFVLTSLQEAATHVVMESLASGLPVVCHDACGMGVAVNESCGLKVPLRDPDTSITGFAEALAGLYDQPEKLADLSGGAMKRAVELSWEAKALEVAQAYDRVLAGVSG